MKTLACSLVFGMLVCGALAARAQSSACQMDEVRVHEGVKWGGVVTFPIDIPWSLTWVEHPDWPKSGKGKYTKFWFDEKRNQYGFFWGNLRDDGNGSLYAQFQNRSDIDGDHFAAVVSVVDASGKPIRTMSHAGGANAMKLCKAGGKGHECWRSTSPPYHFKLTPSELERVRAISVRPGMYNTVDDAAVLKNIRTAAQCIAGGT